MTTQTETPALEQLELDQLKEHPDNPRKHFDDHVLEEMAASIRQVGVLVPLLVRRNGSGYQVLAGARRFRAAKRAGLEVVPAIVRELDDAAALELMVLDNLQRQDLHPLEEAAGFQQLMKVAHYDVARVAERVGRSVKYVYDRVKLLELTKDAKQLFLEGKFAAGHAILLARLKPADQTRALAFDPDRVGHARDGGVFEHEAVLELEESDKEPLKPRSVRELQAWIDTHVKFDVKRDADPMLFPETAQALQVTEKIIPITHEHYVQADARDASRIYGPRSWKRADGIGTEFNYRTGRDVKSKTCDRSQLGVVVVGPERGEAFQVCVNRSCEVHFPAQAKKAKAAASSKPAAPPKPDKWEVARQKRDELEARWKKALPEILKAVAERVKKATAHRGGALCNLLVDHLKPNSGGSAPASYVPLGSHPEDVVRFAAWLVIYEQAGAWLAWEHFPKLAGKLGVDVRKILKAEAPAQTPAAAKPRESGSGKTRAKRTAKKGGRK